MSKTFHYKTNGSAGYGKSHTMCQDIKATEAQGCKVIVMTPTHQAKSVLNKRFVAAGVNARADVFHRTLYKPVPNGTYSVQEPAIDPETNELIVDPITKEIKMVTVQKIKWDQTINKAIKGAIVYVDEASMCPSFFWRDLIELSDAAAVYSYGDEKQLPPVADNMDDPNNKASEEYIGYWHNKKADRTLMVNYRQQGPLKMFVDSTEAHLFGKNSDMNLPMLQISNNSVIDASSPAISSTRILDEICEAQIIVTTTNALRIKFNEVAHLIKLIEDGHTDMNTPLVEGERIIFKQNVKDSGTGLVTIYNNLRGKVAKIHQFGNWMPPTKIRPYRVPSVALIDVVDEHGTYHSHVAVSLSTCLGMKNSDKGFIKIDYAYAVTVHSSQGGQWTNVLFIDGFWPKNTLDDQSPAQLRYVAVTRASSQIKCITNSTFKGKLVPNLEDAVNALITDFRTA